MDRKLKGKRCARAAKSDKTRDVCTFWMVTARSGHCMKLKAVWRACMIPILSPLRVIYWSHVSASHRNRKTPLNTPQSSGEAIYSKLGGQVQAGLGYSPETVPNSLRTQAQLREVSAQFELALHQSCLMRCLLWLLYSHWMKKPKVAPSPLFSHDLWEEESWNKERGPRNMRQVEFINWKMRRLGI